MGFRRHGISAQIRLIIAMRALARYHNIAVYRIAAASQADSIPQSFAEKMPGTIKGSIAKQARALMKSMKTMSEDDRIIAAETLRNFADILSSPGAGEIVSDDKPGRNSRRRALAGP